MIDEGKNPTYCNFVSKSFPEEEITAENAINFCKNDLRSKGIKVVILGSTYGASDFCNVKEMVKTF